MKNEVLKEVNEIIKIRKSTYSKNCKRAW